MAAVGASGAPEPALAPSASSPSQPTPSRGRGRGDAQVTAVARRDVKQGDAVELDPADAHAVEPGRVGPRAAHPEYAECVRAARRIGRGGPDAPQRACERAAVLGLAVLERAVADVLRERRPLVGVERGRAVERVRRVARLEHPPGSRRPARWPPCCSA